MGSLVDTRTAWLVALRAGLPAVNVFGHGGSFDRKQLEAYSKKAPALALALLRFDPVKQGGATTCIATWGLVGFTVNSRQGRGDRDELCIDLMERASHVILQTFGGESPNGAVSRATEAFARNLFSFELDQMNVAMWGLEFQQQIDLAQTFDSAPFERMHLTWDLAPRDNDPPVGEIPEAEDDIELE